MIIPIVNFIFWFLYGQRLAYYDACEGENSPLHQMPLPEFDETPCPEGTLQNPICNTHMDPLRSNADIQVVNSDKFDKYRAERLASMTYPQKSGTVIIRSHMQEPCEHYAHATVASIDARKQCYGVVRVSNLDRDHNVVRFEADIDEAGLSKTSTEHAAARKKDKNYQLHLNQHNMGRERPTGYFRKVPKV